MYNSELKTKFLQSYTTRLQTASDAKTVFEKIASTEEKYDTDFACMTDEQALEAINSLGYLRSASLEFRIGVLRQYVRWNISIGMPGVNSNIIELEATDVSHLRKKLVKNPMHLAQILNAIYAPVSDGTTDNLYRLYIWLFYAGMNDEQVFKCTKDDVDYKNMSICVDGEYFPIYREYIDVVVFCCDAEEITERRTIVTKSRSKSPRIPGNELYRGVIQNKNPNSARSNIAARLASEYHKGTVDVMLSRTTLTFSGMFYRMYERETMGFPIDFTNDALRIMKGKNYKIVGNRTLNVKRGRIVRDLEDDYGLWKEAYNL